MKISMLTLNSFVDNARRIGGHDAFVSTIWQNIPAHPDLLLIFLHPSADGHAWLNDEREVMVTADQIRAATNLHGAVVFVGACYGLEDDAMIEALKSAGARAVIAGPGVNIGGSDGWLAGADIMAGALRSALQIGLPIGAAWAIARAIVHVARVRGRAGAEDALAYRLLSFGEGQPAGVWTRLAAIIAGIIGLLYMLLTALSGGPPAPLIFFSSIIPPPAQIAVWDKSAYRNDAEVDIGASIYLTDTDALTVTDWITPSEPITFTLVETWDTSAVSLTAWAVTAGDVITDGGVLTWTVTDAITSGYGLTKTWSPVTDTWTIGAVTETLMTTEPQTVTLALIHGDVPTPTSTPTDTPTPTNTPTNTPTPTPVVIAGWDKTAYHNSTPVALSQTIYLTGTDALSVTDWFTPSEPITFTLIEAWDTSAISLTDWLMSAGDVITDSGILTWTVTEPITGAYGLTKTWSTVDDAWETSTLTETLTTTETQTIALALAHGVAPTPTPTPTSTPTRTPTPTNTPTPTATPRYALTAIPFGTATPRPTVLCCQVTPGTRLAYVVYLPIIRFQPLEFSIDPPIGGD